MASITQKPGSLDITYTKEDDLSFLVVLGFSVSEATFHAVVETTGSGTEIAIDVSVEDAATGRLRLSFSHETFGVLSIGDHEWYLKVINGGSERKWLAGAFKVVKR